MGLPGSLLLKGRGALEPWNMSTTGGREGARDRNEARSAAESEPRSRGPLPAAAAVPDTEQDSLPQTPE